MFSYVKCTQYAQPQSYSDDNKGSIWVRSVLQINVYMGYLGGSIGFGCILGS
jgi:hypothetical protein